jgi:hypothetical protein
MMELEGDMRKLFDRSLRDYTARENAWWKQDRRGRWVVLEPGPGRLLKGSPRHIRDYVDAIMEQRGRRFSSLSRARAFAREVGGVVRRWRRHMHRCVLGRNVKATWLYETNPWARATRDMPLLGCWLPDKEAA